MTKFNQMNSSSMDPKSGFCSETKIYHSLRPHVPLPPETDHLSVTDYVFYLLHQKPYPSTGTSTALVDAATRRRIPLTELVLRVKNLAAALQRGIGLSKGDVAFILSPNSVNIPILYLSLLSLGVIVCPSNPASSKQEISRQIQLCKPVIAFVTSDTAHMVPSLRHPMILLDSPEFDSMQTRQTETLRRFDVPNSHTAAILYSSGTTGKIKGVELTHRNITSVLAGAHAGRPARSSPAVAFCTVPYFHVYGFVYCVRTIAFGDNLVSMAKFDLRLMVRAVEEFRVTQIALSPPVIVAIVNNGDVVDGYDLSSLEAVLSGGAPVTNSMIERFKRRFPSVSLAQAYGLTETTAAITRPAGPYETQRLGASGRLIPNHQAKIVNPETGIGLPPLKQGELWIRGPSIMQGYVDDKEATAAILDSEGWIKTGDLCYFDNEGFLFFVERIKELIKYKGYQVAPAELEHLLLSHPDIAEAAVIPYPDEEAGQVPMAFVVKRSGSTIDETQIKDFVAKQVAPYKKIRRVLFVNSIPKNAPGKVLRKELIKLALSSTTAKL